MSMYSGVFAMKICRWHNSGYNKLAILASFTKNENSVAPCWDSSVRCCACIRCSIDWKHSFLSLSSRSPGFMKLTAATHGYDRPSPIYDSKEQDMYAVLSALAAFSTFSYHTFLLYLLPNTMTPSWLVSLMRLFVTTESVSLDTIQFVSLRSGLAT